MSGTNIGPMKAIEHWTENDTPFLSHGKQSHWPIGGSGRAMSKKGTAKGLMGSDRDGIKHKVRGSAIMAIKSRASAKKAAYRSGGKTKKASP